MEVAGIQDSLEALTAIEFTGEQLPQSADLDPHKEAAGPPAMLRRSRRPC